MTDERMALLELIEKGADADLVRELLAFASERLPRPARAGRACGDGSSALRSMAAEVDQLTGAAAGVRSPDRVNHRNGYRERSRAPLSTGNPGRADRARHPQAAQGLVLPGLPRLTAPPSTGARPRRP
jgi:hypothetical protein